MPANSRRLAPLNQSAQPTPQHHEHVKNFVVQPSPLTPFTARATVLTGLGLTACGGGDDSTTSSTSTITITTTTTAGTGTGTSTTAASTAGVLCNYATSAFNSSASVNKTATATRSCSSTLRSLTANVPQAVSGESQDRPFAAIARGAKADLQFASSFFRTWLAPVQRFWSLGL